MTFNQSLILLVVAIALGFVAITFVELLAVIAFWIAIGVAASAAVDVVAGLGERACVVRASVRRWWTNGAQFTRSNVVRFRN